jgi:NADPH:quinone reductase-like Zn-dependent oxidoreductase
MLGVGALIGGQGTLGEYICISSKTGMVAPVPANISTEEAAALGIGPMMAWLSCKDAGMVGHQMKRVLINGASGGCGTATVQVVKALGAEEVIATCSSPNEELVKSIGADKTIDYRKDTPLHDYLAKEYSDHPFDTIIDIVGNQSLYANSPKYLKEGSTFVNLGDFVHGPLWTIFYWFCNTWWPTWLGGTPRKYVMSVGQVDAKGVEMIGRWLEEGKLRAVLEKCVDFEQVLDGFDLVVTKRVRGRVVVKVAGANA